MASYSDDDDDEYGEAYDVYEGDIRPAPPSIRTAGSVSLMAPSTVRAVPASEARLQMVVNAFNARIGQNSNAIQRVNASVAGVGRELRRQDGAIRDTRRDVAQLRDLTLILPLLQDAVGTQNQQLSLLLPFMLAGGIGGDSGGGGGLFGGGGNSLMMILLLTGLLNPKGSP
jgi:hypothetical protein